MKRKKLLYISLCTHISHICTCMCTCVPVNAHKHTHTHVYEGGNKTYRLNYPKLSTFKSEIHKNLIGFNLYFYLEFFDYRDLLVCMFTWQVCRGQVQFAGLTSFLLLHHVAPKDRGQDVCLGSKHCYLLRHLVSPFLYFKM